MCIAMNGDQLEPGQYAVSTSNRNFEGRQGKGGRTFLASPLTAAATAIAGNITDVRTMLSCTVFEPDQKPWLNSRSSNRTRSRSRPTTSTPTRSSPRAISKMTDKAGLGAALFADWRYNPDGSPKPEFVLNTPRAQGAQILLAGDNFGCGSSREHAPWALTGLRLPRRHQHLVCRHLPEQRAQERPAADRRRTRRRPCGADELRRASAATPSWRSIWNRRALTLPAGRAVSFPIDPFSRSCLLNGTDELGYLLSFEREIAAFEGCRALALGLTCHGRSRSTTPPCGTARSARGSRSRRPTRSASRTGWTSWGSPSSRAAGPARTRRTRSSSSAPAMCRGRPR